MAPIDGARRGLRPRAVERGAAGPCAAQRRRRGAACRPVRRAAACGTIKDPLSASATAAGAGAGPTAAAAAGGNTTYAVRGGWRRLMRSAPRHQHQAQQRQRGTVLSIDARVKVSRIDGVVVELG